VNCCITWYSSPFNALRIQEKHIAFNVSDFIRYLICATWNLRSYDEIWPQCRLTKSIMRVTDYSWAVITTRRYSRKALVIGRTRLVSRAFSLVTSRSKNNHPRSTESASVLYRPTILINTAKLRKTYIVTFRLIPRIVCVFVWRRYVVAIKHVLTYLLKWIELVFAMMVATEDSYFVLDGCIRWCPSLQWNEPGELSQWPRHDDSTINTVNGNSIIRPHIAVCC